MNDKLTAKLFLNKVLAGTATGIIIGLIPNAVLGAILKYFSDIPFVYNIISIGVIFQLATPAIIGGFIALQFGFNPMRMMTVVGAAFTGSGVIQLQTDTNTYVGSGTGDIINTMITAAIAALFILWIGDKFGSVAIVFLPIVAGIGASVIGFTIYPYITMLSSTIGNVIYYFTTLQPVLMSIFIGCSFAFLILSPISTVAIGMAIQLQGISAAAASMGVAATTIVLIVHSWKVNKSGVILAIALGAMKMMMPNMFRKPIILVPCFMTAIISAIPVAVLSIVGTSSSAGFGLVGLIGPLTSIDAGLSIIWALICWLIIPLASALSAKLLCEKILQLYRSEEAFKFLGN